MLLRQLNVGAEHEQMAVRRELLIATTLAVAIHGYLVLLGIGVSGITSSQLRTPTAHLQSPQPWILSMEKVSETMNHSSKDEVQAESAGKAVTQTSDMSTSQKASKPVLEKALASTFANGFANSKYLPLEETDTPALPAANWILPLKKGYLSEISSIVVRVWIQQSGSIAGVELLDVHPGLLSNNQMQEVVDWLASTPMNPAVKNGENVASKRTLEIAFEH